MFELILEVFLLPISHKYNLISILLHPAHKELGIIKFKTKRKISK